MSKKVFFTVLILLSIVSISFAHKTEYQKYKAKYNKKYDNAATEAYRQAVYSQNVDKINKHNQDPQRTYDQGQNLFTDMTQEQFQQNYLGLQLPDIAIVDQNGRNDDPQANVPENNGNLRNLQAVSDWRPLGKVTPVKNQGACGSCWAFSANGAMESLSLIKDSTTRIFSQQQLVDCSSSFGNSGCNGGLMTNAFKYVIKNGIELSSNYPYVAKIQTCKKNGGAFKILSYTSYSTQSGLIGALGKGPVSVAVDATNWSPYSSGVFSNCGTSLNHGVLLVAIVSNNWVIKNSWGTGWGASGYITLAAGNTCGIWNMASLPAK